MLLQGAFTALITPFRQDGGLDLPALKRLVKRQIQGGIDGLVPTGTTGESPTLTPEETMQVITTVVDEAAGKLPVIAGTGSNSTEKAIHLTRDAKAAGVTASLQVAPYYNKPTPEGFYRHFMAIADAVELPMVIYNIPGRTGKNIDTPTMLRLAQHENVIAVKEASGDINQMMDLLAAKPPGLSILSGDDNMTFPLMAMGGAGVISVASNLVPDRVRAMVAAALEERWDEARRAHYDLLGLFRAIFVETNPIPIKAALAHQGLCSETYRLPMCAMTDDNRAALLEMIRPYLS